MVAMSWELREIAHQRQFDHLGRKSRARGIDKFALEFLTETGVGGSERAVASEANYAAWTRQREALLVTASEPSLKAQTITSLARRTARQKDIESILLVH